MLSTVVPDISNIPLLEIIELACAAQRYNKRYVKEHEIFLNIDEELHPNKHLILSTLKILDERYNLDITLEITKEDKQLASDIYKFYQRLLFSAILNENEFQSKLYVILQADTVKLNEVGFVACLPHAYQHDIHAKFINQKIKNLDHTHLSEVDAKILDKDCDIIECSRSKNYDAWNILAIIENKLIGWMSKQELKQGPCVVISAKIKKHSDNWKYNMPVTLLNYVRYIQ